MSAVNPAPLDTYHLPAGLVAVRFDRQASTWPAGVHVNPEAELSNPEKKNPHVDCRGGSLFVLDGDYVVYHGAVVVGVASLDTVLAIVLEAI